MSHSALSPHSSKRIQATKHTSKLVVSVALGVVFAGAELAAKQNITQNQLKPRVVAQKGIHARIGVAAKGYVVVKFAEDRTVRLRAGRLVELTGKDIRQASAALTQYQGVRFKRHFEAIEEARLDKDKITHEIASGLQLADLNNYYRIEVGSSAEAEQLIAVLIRLPEIENAYFQPWPEVAGDILPPTPDFVGFQDYREAAPAGIDADSVNNLPGGDGTGVRIFDIEFAWQDTHEDLDKALGQIITPVVGSDRNHGTAVLGELIGGDNGYGVTGVCPGADVGMVSVQALSVAEALYTAVLNAEPADEILIELHAPGPHFNFEVRDDQTGYVCMEYWQDNFDAIQYAWAKGVVVCEAAGNGAENFDDASIYGQLFDTTFRNSHAIVIGAGFPAVSPSDRRRQSFSNYGKRVNLQGYGSLVTTTGYGELFNPVDENQYYTATFSGTSSASPIVTGAAACLQGYYMANFGARLTADQIRDALVATGTPQLGDTTQHIGPRPNLLTAITVLNPPSAIYSEPFVLDTTVDEGTSVTIPIWLHNRSTTTSYDFTLEANDSVQFRGVANWLDAAPTAGSVGPADSQLVNVTIDASVIASTLTRYVGSVDISWGTGVPDSLVRVPVYVTVPCHDETYTSTSTNDNTLGYEWVDARTLGTRIDTSDYYNSQAPNPLDDGSTGPYAIGFDFPYYGTMYDSFYIGVNGAISFTQSDVNVGGYFAGFTIPGAPFNTLIAVFWADHIINTLTEPNSGIYIYRSPANDSLVIEWHRVENFNALGTVSTFQLILTSAGDIKGQYLEVEGSGLFESAIIGLQEVDCKAIGFYNGDNGPNQMVNSDAVQFEFAPVYILTGNVDGQGGIDIADLTYLISFMFIDYVPPPDMRSADLDCDGAVDISDLTLLIDYLFISNREGCYYLL